jgi:geranylgeranyl pyrophosphate synthase
MAVLAGDALLTLAFECFAGRGMPKTASQAALAMIGHQVAVAAGSSGLVGGQVMDIQQYAKDQKLETLETTCYKKTGCLIEVSLECGALLADAKPAWFEALRAYGRKIGLAFQVADDILNVTGDAVKLGKAVKTDASHDKVTFPELLGVEGATAFGRSLIVEAKTAIAFLGEPAWMLQDLADFVIERQH